MKSGKLLKYFKMRVMLFWRHSLISLNKTEGSFFLKQENDSFLQLRIKSNLF